MVSLQLLLNWWLSPIDGATEHHLPDWLIWHARTMVLAWAILLPLGVLAARYFKVMPNQDWPRHIDNRAWWHAHLGLQLTGVAFMLLGLYLSWNQQYQSTTVATLHSYIGWFVVGLGFLQIFAGVLRGSKGGPTETKLRGDHYDMTAHRLRFEWVHKTFGWLAIGLAVATVLLGLWAANAPRWMVLVLCAWWMALLWIGWRLEKAGRCIDTYQAIWGVDPKHPGNQRAQGGWRMRRHQASERKMEKA